MSAIDSLTDIPAHEIVYIYTRRVKGELMRRLLWHEAGVIHRASLDPYHAQLMGLDILEGSRLCAPWAVVQGLIDLALFENLGL